MWVAMRLPCGGVRCAHGEVYTVFVARVDTECPPYRRLLPSRRLARGCHRRAAPDTYFIAPIARYLPISRNPTGLWGARRSLRRSRRRWRHNAVRRWLAALPRSLLGIPYSATPTATQHPALQGPDQDGRDRVGLRLAGGLGHPVLLAFKGRLPFGLQRGDDLQRLLQLLRKCQD
jgi:hypothetical protein